MDSTMEWLQSTLAKEYALAPQQLMPEALLADLGIDSLGMMELFFSVEDRFGIKVPQGNIALERIGDVAHYIDQLVLQQSAQHKADRSTGNTGAAVQRDGD